MRILATILMTITLGIAPSHHTPAHCHGARPVQHNGTCQPIGRLINKPGMAYGIGLGY